MASLTFYSSSIIRQGQLGKNFILHSPALSAFRLGVRIFQILGPVTPKAHHAVELCMQARMPDPAARSHVRCVNEMPMGSTLTRQARPLPAGNTANSSQTKSEKESSTTKTARANFSEIACVVFRDA